MTPDDMPLHDKLLMETARIGWRELERFWAKGQVVQVATTLDLVAAGVALAEDDAARVQRWMQRGELGPVSKQQARQWHADATEVWALVIAPWVLVQHRPDSSESATH